MSSENLHAPASSSGKKNLDLYFPITSLMEHTSMLLEWIPKPASPCATLLDRVNRLPSRPPAPRQAEGDGNGEDARYWIADGVDRHRLGI